VLLQRILDNNMWGQFNMMTISVSIICNWRNAQSLRRCLATCQRFCSTHCLQKNIDLGDFLSSVWKQWFLLLNLLAHLQLVLEPTQLFNDSEVSNLYINQVEAIVESQQFLKSCS
jgi:hypothetical protein